MTPTMTRTMVRVQVSTRVMAELLLKARGEGGRALPSCRTHFLRSDSSQAPRMPLPASWTVSFSAIFWTVLAASLAAEPIDQANHQSISKLMTQNPSNDQSNGQNAANIETLLGMGESGTYSRRHTLPGHLRKTA